MSSCYLFEYLMVFLHPCPRVKVPTDSSSSVATAGNKHHLISNIRTFTSDTAHTSTWKWSLCFPSAPVQTRSPPEAVAGRWTCLPVPSCFLHLPEWLFPSLAAWVCQPQFFYVVYFETISNFQKSFKNSTRISILEITSLIDQLLSFCHISFVIHIFSISVSVFSRVLLPVFLNYLSTSAKIITPN